MWKEGVIGVHSEGFHYWVKRYEKRSQFGIDGGKISKLMIKRKGEVVCNYDRGWDTKPVDENTQIVLQILLLEYN